MNNKIAALLLANKAETIYRDFFFRKYIPYLLTEFKLFVF